jgi:hypothetical protein
VPSKVHFVNKEKAMSARLIALATVVALVGVFVGAQFHHEPSVQAQMPGSSMGGQFKPLTLVLEGNFRVTCECAFNDKDKTGASLKEELIKKIEFHPEYIVLTNQYGGGRVIPVYAIKQLTWEPT